MDTKHTTFIKPYLSFIDKGKLFKQPFNWLYTVLAIINLLLPFYIMYEAINNKVFNIGTDFTIVFTLMWLIIAFVSFVSFQLWWDRKSKVLNTSTEGDEFIATPVFSHFIQTLGEWLGTWVAIVGFATALLTTLFLGEEAYYLLRSVGVSFLKSGWSFVVLMPIYGFLIIVASRFLAEQFKALTSIANSVGNKKNDALQKKPLSNNDKKEKLSKEDNTPKKEDILKNQELERLKKVLKDDEVIIEMKKTKKLEVIKKEKYELDIELHLTGKYKLIYKK